MSPAHLDPTKPLGERVRAALSPLTDAQRLALAIEIVNAVRDPHSRLQLIRLERLAIDIRTELERAPLRVERLREAGL